MGGTQEQVCCPGAHPTARIALNGGRTVSAILIATDQIVASYVLAHGAGAGMTHPFLSAVPEGLATRGIATLRYQFPYMERDRDIRTGQRVPAQQDHSTLPGVCGIVFLGFLLIRPADLRMCEHPSLPESNVRAAKERSEELR